MSFRFFRAPKGSSPILRIPGLGLELETRLESETSGGDLAVIETVNAPGFGPPLHRHREAEVFRVLEGRYLYEVNGQRFEAATGDLVSVPGGHVHAFTNISNGPSRQLVMILPAMNAARLFAELGDLFAMGKPTLETLNAFGKPWGVEFLGPPISARRD